MHARTVHPTYPTARFTSAGRGGSPLYHDPLRTEKARHRPSQGRVCTRSVPPGERGLLYACVFVWAGVFSPGLAGACRAPSQGLGDEWAAGDAAVYASRVEVASHSYTHSECARHRVHPLGGCAPLAAQGDEDGARPAQTRLRRHAVIRPRSHGYTREP